MIGTHDDLEWEVMPIKLASGTIKLDIKGEAIEFHDEDQVNALITQLQREFQQWTTTVPSP